ncbi:MAG TPA: serine/threonine-protein kinase [Humibacter sp.]|nr:serine/threonine-protein kinase [Humibacter sp.]
MSRRVATQAPDLPGYDYQRLLGSGGFSDVFLYEQKLPRRKVAVKVLLTDELDQQSRTQFVAEANVMAQLSAHPYIVTIYHADVSADDRPYFVMEYCSGPSLAERYKRERLPVEDALRIGIRVAGAVATAHAAGILHRDIKPANVLTNDFGWPALTDFGISSALEEELPVHTTTFSRREAATAVPNDSTTRQSVGLSVPWSPPEMFEDDPKPDVRSDVFSLAATVYTVIAGHTPFEIPGRSNGTLDLIGRIERGAITPIDRPDVPRTLVAVLAKGMASRREDRFATAVDFARAMQRVEMELGYSPSGIEVPNLVSSARPERETADSGDETMVRSLSTVLAQKPSPPAPVAPTPPPPSPAARVPSPSAASAPDAEATRLRGMPAVAAQVPGPASEHTVIRSSPVSASAAEAPVVDEQEEPPSKRRTGLIVGVVAAVIVVIVAVVVTIALVPHGSTPKPAAHSAGGDDGTIQVSSVPDPKLKSAVRSADGTSVTFTWTNPKPKANDHYEWQQEGTTHGAETTNTPTATVTGLTPGSAVCVDVRIIRSGVASPNPLKACNP